MHKNGDMKHQFYLWTTAAALANSNRPLGPASCLSQAVPKMTELECQQLTAKPEFLKGSCTASIVEGTGDRVDGAVTAMGNVIFCNSSVSIDLTDEATLLSQTITNEEDSPGLTALPPVSMPGNRTKNNRYPSELCKTIIALLILCFNFFLTATSLTIVHEFMPEQEALPDIILNNLPYQGWSIKH